jgi:hypothetical protein
MLLDVGSLSDGRDALTLGPLFRFSDPLDASIPRVAAGCYTIWDLDDRFLYAGMAGRAMTVASIAASRSALSTRMSGLRSRLSAHQNGRRSGDQFCVYVFDYFVLPRLSPADIAQVLQRTRRLDDDVRAFVQTNLSYRWYETADAATAFALERSLVNEGIRGRLPFINPGRPETEDPVT